VSLLPARGLIVGVDIGATKIAAGLGTPHGRIQARLVISTPREDPDRLVTAVADLVAELARGQPRVTAVGLGTCGRVDPVDQSVMSSIALGWSRPVALRALLEARTGLPVFIDNDVNAGALGEHAWGAGHGVDDLIYLGVGTGIGAGIVLGGRLYRGATGAAGEIGHMVIDLDGPPCPCGNRGCLEVLAGGKALGAFASTDVPGDSALAAIALGQGAVSARDVFEAARAGDAHAQRLVRRTAEYLAVAIVNVVNVFDPQRVILGGGLAQTGDLLVTAVREALGHWTGCFVDGRKALVSTALGQDAALVGAVAVARHGLEARS
jgi:glucokinase